MAWIESHQELWRHPKTKKLARLLQISIPTAVGHLHGLWYWAMDFAQDGDLSAYDAEDIADAVMWDGDAKTFLNALVEARYADATEHGIVIHDWFDYAGGLLESKARKREQSRLRVQEYRKRKKEAAAHEEGTPQEAPPQGPEPPNESKPPPIPYAKIMAAYNEISPASARSYPSTESAVNAGAGPMGHLPQSGHLLGGLQKGRSQRFYEGCKRYETGLLILTG